MEATITAPTLPSVRPTFFFPQVLWSDPSDSDLFMAQGVHGSPRGAGIITFGPDVTRAFCQRNKLKLVIRSHQLAREGFKIMHGGRLITVFSARNYVPGPQRRPNDAALLLLAEDESGNLRVRVKRVHSTVSVGAPDRDTVLMEEDAQR